jgi:four helix bundle protein
MQRVFDIKERTLNFSVEIVKFVRSLPKDTAYFVISDQLVKFGTSIGANVIEAQNCNTKRDFIHTFTISLKEARETEYWLLVLLESGLSDPDKLKELLSETREIIKILTSIIKKTKANLS